MRIRKHAGHAVAAAIDAVQHDVAASGQRDSTRVIVD
jgi:hypothetical protein